MAHNSLNDQICVTPLIGHPGVGYESVGQRVDGVLFEKMDSMGSRSSSLFPEEWSYDIGYVWRKACQASEKGKARLWSFGGQNAIELCALTWPLIIYLQPPEFEELVRRKNAFRQTVNEPPLSHGEIEFLEQRMEREASWIKFYKKLNPNLAEISSSASINEVAAAVHYELIKRAIIKKGGKS